MKTSESLATLPLLPRDAEGPVFAAPWHALAFAAVVELIDSGTLTQKEWADRLGATFREAETNGETHTGERYYEYWLSALEQLAVEKDLTGWGDLAEEVETMAANDHHRREEQLGHGHHHH